MNIAAATPVLGPGAVPRWPAPELRIDTLDGWRGLAIALVLQSHFFPWAAVDSGRLGVDIFFCLSGMLMSQLLFIRRTPLGLFYKRRISRIVPAFIVFVLSLYGINAGLGNSRSAEEFVATLLFLRTHVPAQPDIWNTGLPIGHLWSLNVEEHCYVFLSLLSVVAALRGREAWALLGTGVVAMALHNVYSANPATHGQSFEIRTEVAASFVLISAGYCQVRDRVAAKVKAWAPMLSLGVVCLGYLPGASWWVGAIVSPLALAFAVNHLAASPAVVRQFLAAAPMRYLGLWSYSLYLWQLPFFAYQTWRPAGAALPGAMLAGLASYYVLERPCRVWLNTVW